MEMGTVGPLWLVFWTLIASGCAHRLPETVSRGQTAPAAQQLAFVSDRDGSVQIYIMNVDGSGPTRLTGPAGNAMAPVWASDGRRLAFVVYEAGNPHIYVMNAEGSGKTRLAGQGPSAFPAWSPDGQHIAFVAAFEGAFQIFVINADGTGQRRLTEIPGEHGSPAWSPDGQHIAFVARRGTPDPEVYVVNAAGADEMRLASRGVLLRRGFMEPVWSPDGQRLLFVSELDQRIAIYSSPIDGGAPTVLADGYAPAWSPDGRRIAYACCFPSPDLQIYVMNADGSGQTPLTHGPPGSTFPAWSPDGKSIAFVCCWPGEMHIHVMNPDGSSSKRIAVGATPKNLGPGGGSGPIMSWRPHGRP